MMLYTLIGLLLALLIGYQIGHYLGWNRRDNQKHLNSEKKHKEKSK